MNAERSKQKLPDHMNAVRQKEPGGKLIIESVGLPRPEKGQVLVRMHAAPVNPSDLALLKGGYLERNYPFTPGLEGSGEVVQSGRGILPGLRLGTRVACTPDPGSDGTWAEYMVTAATRTAPLPKGLAPEQGSMMLVNPMTAMALMKIARRGRHRAMVNNAAASALGKMLVRLARKDHIPLINIVRSEEQAGTLKEMGADVILNSSHPGFGEELQRYCSEWHPTLLLDAIGGSHAALLLKAAPFGSQLICYARLSGEPVPVDPGALISESKAIRGFQLGNWLETQSLLTKIRMLRQVRKALPEELSSPIRQIMPMAQVEQAIAQYQKHMSAGKMILWLSDSAPPSPSN